MFTKKASKFDKKNKKNERINKNNFNKPSTDEQKSVPDLICKSFTDGCLILGCVHQISHDELAITLPGINNFGYVKLNRISTEYTNYLQKVDDKRNFTQLSDLYIVGTLLRCKVLNYTNQRLLLTIEPQEINANLKNNDLDVDMIISGSVKSKEDHGYSINLGINDTIGFLKTEDVNEELPVGKTLNFKITNINKRVVNLQPISKEFDKIKYKSNFNVYLPGSKLSCVVEKVYKNGLKLTINGVQALVGYIHVNHLNVKLTSLKTLQTKYKHGDKLEATGLYINPYSKIIYLTQLDHLLNNNYSSKIEEMILLNKLNVGTFIKDAKIIRHSFKGMHVAFNFDKYKNQIGFITKRDLIDKDELEEKINNDKIKEKNNNADDDDDNEEKCNETLTQYYWKNITKEFVEKYYPINKKIANLRVINFNLIDNLIMLTASKTKLDENTFLNYNDSKLKAGEVVKCKVASFIKESGGIVVNLSENVKGFLPKIHTADIPLKDPLAKMPIDKEIKCKIININPNDRKLILTAKKTLINLKKDEEIYAINDNLKEGLITYGVIVAIKEYGLLIGFYNDIKALIHIAEIPNIERQLNKPVELEKYFNVGQLVKCRLIKVDLEKQQLKMSLKLDDKQIEEEKKNTLVIAKQKDEKKFRMKYQVGDLVTPNSTTQFLIHYKNSKNGYFFIKISQPNSKYSEFAVLYKYHLSDNDTLNDCLFDLLSKQTNLNEFLTSNNDVNVQSLLVLHDKKLTDDESKKNKGYRKYYLTIKKSLLNVYTDDIEHANGVKNDNFIVGWVCKKQDKGILVEIVSKNLDLTTGQMAYCSNKIIKKQNLSLDDISIGQSVLFKLNNDEKRNNLSLIKQIYLYKTLNYSSKYNKETEFALNYLSSTFSTSNLIIKSNLLDSYKLSGFSRLNWLKYLKDLKNVGLLSRISVIVKSIDAQSNRVDCVYEEDHVCLNAYGYLNINDYLDEKLLVGHQLTATIISYDHEKMSLCVALEPNQQEYLKKHKHTLNTHKNLDVLKFDQIVKGEIVGFTNNYCILILKQHAIGRLAYMPIFKDDKIQSKNIEQLQKLALIDDSIKKDYSNYYSIGQIGKFIIKSVNNDFILCKLEGKLKQKVIKNEEAVEEIAGEETKTAVKRKAENEVDSIEIVSEKKIKNVKIHNDSGIGDNIDYPWEITNFDQFYEIIRDKEPDSINENEKLNGDSEPLRKKHKKKTQFEQIDKEIAKQEEKLFERQLDANNAETSDDYERLLISNPNSSLIWIRYIVFYLQSAEIDKSRQVAERALKTILYKDENERINVWVAYLNLENIYGSQDKLEEVFQRAIQNCDSLKMYQHLAEIYARSNKIEEAQTLYNKMIRKFNRNPEVWIKYAIFEYRNNNSEVARKLLIKCLNVLEKKDHIDIVNKFAQLEFKYGDIERAKTMYDSLLFTYPNRTDLWSVYIDMLVKYDRKNEARNVFNRIIQLNLNAKRMKFIFKKFIDFEKLNGNEDSIEKVKLMAMKYVENKEEVFRMIQQNQQRSNDIEMGDNNDDFDDNNNISNDLEKNLIKKLKV